MFSYYRYILSIYIRNYDIVKLILFIIKGTNFKNHVLLIFYFVRETMETMYFVRETMYFVGKQWKQCILSGKQCIL